jgi:hypothetical protein
MFVGEVRGKSKLEVGGNSGVGGGNDLGLPDVFGLSGLIPGPREPPDIRRIASNGGEEAVPVSVSIYKVPSWRLSRERTLLGLLRHGFYEARDRR